MAQFRDPTNNEKILVDLCFKYRTDQNRYVIRDELRKAGFLVHDDRLTAIVLSRD